MKWKLIGYAFVTVIKNIDPDDIKELIDKWLDPLEEKYKTKTGFIPACNLFRAVFSIEDND